MQTKSNNKRSRTGAAEFKQFKKATKKLKREPILASAEVIQTEYQRIGEDPALVASSTQWQDKLVILKGIMGCGKTYFLSQSIGRLLFAEPAARVVYMNPYNASSKEIYIHLRSHLPTATRIAIHSDQTKVHHADWNVLIVHPRSMHLFDIDSCDMLIVDELTAVNDQLSNWDQSSTKVRVSIQRTFKVLSLLVPNSRRVVLCCAQIRDRTIHHWRELTTTIAPRPVLLIECTREARKSTLTLLRDHATFLQQIWSFVLNGERVAVAVDNARTAKKLHAWLNLKILAHNAIKENETIPTSQNELWTAESLRIMKRSQLQDITTFLTERNTRAIFYTNALSPGISINHHFKYWSTRFIYLCRSDGPSLATMAQILNRIRHPGNHRIFCYIHRVKHNRNIPVTSRWAEKFPDSLEGVVDPTTNKFALAPRVNVTNEIRFDQWNERKMTEPSEILATLQMYMDNAQIELDPEIQSAAPCPLWKKIDKATIKRADALFLTQREIDAEDGARLTSQESTTTRLLNDSRRVMIIRSFINPPMVSMSHRYLNLHLNKEAFQSLLKAPHVFDNLRLLCVTTPDEFNTRLETRMQLLKLKNTESVALNDRIRPCEIFFLLTRLLLAEESISSILHPSTLALIRAGLGVDRYAYLSGQNSNIESFIHEHGTMLLRIFSKHYKTALRKIVHGRKSIDAKFKLSIFRMCLTQCGIGLNKKHTKQLHHSANKPWLDYGIEIEQVIERLREPIEIKDSYSEQICDDCKTGEVVTCLRQEGLWRCVHPRDIGRQAHRLRNEPLDESINETDVCEAKSTSADQLLEICGWTGGVASTLQLTKQEVEGCWNEHSTLKLAFLKELDLTAQSRFADLAAVKVKIPKLLAQLEPLLEKEGLAIVRKQKRVQGARKWLYSIIKI
jgi:hypothetical protein